MSDAGTGAQIVPAPLQYYSAGRQYMEAYAALSTDQRQPDAIRMMLPVCGLLGFAFELLLKAVVSQHQPTLNLRSKRLRHSLLRLHDLAMEADFPEVNGVRPVLETIHAFHESYTFRYMEGGCDIPSWCTKSFVPSSTTSMRKCGWIWALAPHLGGRLPDGACTLRKGVAKETPRTADERQL